MFSLRLKELREKAGYSQAELARKLNVRQSTVGMWENGTNKPKNAKLEQMASLFNVTTDYLLGRSDFSSLQQNSKGIPIPVLGRVQAGIPIEAVEEIIDWEEISSELAKKGDFFALRVKGNSMEPLMFEGNILIVQKQSYAETGDIVIALINGDEATVKRYRRLEHGMMLIPYNQAYEPLVFSDEEIVSLPVEIIGVVVENRQKFKYK